MDNKTERLFLEGQMQEQLRKCKFCAEEIQMDAVICKHCGKKVKKVPEYLKVKIDESGTGSVLCKNCGHSYFVPFDKNNIAKFPCPSCGFENKRSYTRTEKRGLYFLGVTLGCIVLFVAYAMFTAPDVPSTFDICHAARHYVTKRLKSPSSASFKTCTDADIRRLGERGYVVSGYVDAQNSFGATLRVRYRCELEYGGNDKWRLISADVYD